MSQIQPNRKIAPLRMVFFEELYEELALIVDVMPCL